MCWAIPLLVDLERPKLSGGLIEEVDPVHWTGVVVLESSSGVDTVRLHFLPPLTARLLPTRSYICSGSAGLAAPS